jgi:hypothetical protein
LKTTTDDNVQKGNLYKLITPPQEKNASRWSGCGEGVGAVPLPLQILNVTQVPTTTTLGFLSLYLYTLWSAPRVAFCGIDKQRQRSTTQNITTL